MVKPLDLGLVGSLVPKKCGIATFGRDLVEGIREHEPATTFVGIAAEEPQEYYKYHEEVVAHLKTDDRRSYLQAAKKANSLGLDAILLQHEYGLYGGMWTSFTQDGVKHRDPTGEYILTFLRALTVPAITTLHTVMPRPDKNRKRVLQEVCRLSNRVVTMSQGSKRILHSVYGVPGYKIIVIPHGVPAVPSVSREQALNKLKLPVKNCYLTITGLLGPNKGIDILIKALPAILKGHPNVRVLIVGQTHPTILAKDGEAYRDSLKKLAKKLHVGHALMFVNKYISTEELMHYMKASDVYFTLHRDPEQSASGTLSYALGTGIPAVSTPYAYARELLANGRGILVPFEDIEAVAANVIQLLDNNEMRQEMKRKIRKFGKKMAWPTVGQSYLQLARRLKVRERAYSLFR